MQQDEHVTVLQRVVNDAVVALSKFMVREFNDVWSELRKRQQEAQLRMQALNAPPEEVTKRRLNDFVLMDNLEETFAALNEALHRLQVLREKV